MEDPLVTVYITNHNYGRYVRQAIESVLSQTMSDYELIVVDDGSTDDSRDVINEYARHPKVRIIFQENKGLNRTNNIALKASRGKYIMRLDADDYLDPQALTVLSSVLNAHENLGLVFPDYYYVDPNGTVIGQERRHDFEADVTLLDQPAHGACTLIRKRFLEDIGGYSEQYRCQDGYDLWLRFIETWDVRNVNLPLFYYRRHGNNLTGDEERIIRTRAEIFEEHALRANPSPCPSLVVIPVRGRSVDPGCLALEPLGDKALLDWTVEAALEAKRVSTVVVTSPDEAVLDYCCSRFGQDVVSVERPVELARENTDLDRTLHYVLEEVKLDFRPEALITLSTETPFRGSMYVDKAVHTMSIFEVDSVIAVRPEDDLFFQHDGSGMVPVGNGARQGQIRFERDYLYRKLPGLNLVSMDFFERGARGLGKRIGHITYTERAAFTVRTNLDLVMAHTLMERGL